MDYLVLENTTLKVSRLCMGGCPMGGYGWGSVREDELSLLQYMPRWMSA